jgi:UDP-N-acetylglucosamine diphosphorylase/glucosamine-1-phosphate N-acetyltransferase
MHIVIFDDIHRESFFPITHTRSVGDLRAGILKLRQRLEYAFGAEDSIVQIDPSLVPLYKERHPDWQINQRPQGDKLYLNSRIKIDDAAIKLIKSLQTDQALLHQDDVIAFRSRADLDDCLSGRYPLSKQQCEIGIYRGFCDLVHDNARLIQWDFDHIFYEEDNFFETETGVSVLDPYKVWIAEDVRISPNVVLDASGGPIVIDSNAKIMANAVILGPAYIGKNSLVKIGAKIYGGSSIGPVCKVGGEIEGSIFQAYSNKQHDGFLGHSYIGEWVNIGADTNNSDLKNTYKNVKAYDYARASLVDCGSQFMGCVLGDHTKTGINVSLNTGLVVGSGSNIFGSRLFSGFIPDFSWGEAEHLTKYRFEEFCQTANLVKKRRGLALSEAEKKLLHTITGE